VKHDEDTAIIPTVIATFLFVIIHDCFPKKWQNYLGSLIALRIKLLNYNTIHQKIHTYPGVSVDDEYNGAHLHPSMCDF
jgi:hypothetical protein